MPNLSIFGQKCLILVFLGHNFKKAAVIFEISTKMPYLDIFGQEFWKNYCHIWNLHPQICLFLTSRKNKITEIWEQKCLIWVFLCSSLKAILPYLKSAPSNSPNCKISWKNKNASIWDQKCLIWVFLTKNALFMYFWATILKELLSYLKLATPEFV